MKKVWSALVLILLVGGAVFFYFRYCFVFGEGVKSGELNYVVYKGVFFKTYEGKLIQSGLRSKAVGSIQSYEFDFSVANERVAREFNVDVGLVEYNHKDATGKKIRSQLEIDFLLQCAGKIVNRLKLLQHIVFCKSTLKFREDLISQQNILRIRLSHGRQQTHIQQIYFKSRTISIKFKRQ